MEKEEVTGSFLIKKENKFPNEKKFVDYLVLNIDQLCLDMLGENIDFFKREYLINPIQPFAKGTNQRADLFIRTASGRNILIECKVPFNLLSDGNRGVTQCLSYLIDAKNAKLKVDKIVLITNRIHPTTLEIVTDYKLPVEIWVIKENTLIGFNKT